MKYAIPISIVLGILLSADMGYAQEHPERWIYLSGDLRSDESARKLINLLRQAKDAGCTHALFTGTRGHRLPNEPPEYFQRVKRFRKEAGKLNIKIIPQVCSTGYAGRYLNVDSNLVAGVPVKNMVFIVKGKTATPDPAQALDMSILKPTKRKTSVTGKLKVKPFLWYRLTFEIVPVTPGKRTGCYASIYSSGHKRRHLRTDPKIIKTKDGRFIFEYVFNTLEATEITVGLHHRNNKLRNAKIEPAGMLLILRRKRIPLTVTSEDGKTVYEEGRDFKPVADPIVAKRPFPGEFPFDHPAPPLQLTNDSRIKDAQKLLISFWHHIRIGSDQDNLSFQDPRMWDIWEEEIKQTHRLWRAEGYMLNYDEIRVALWEPREPGTENLTPGQFLAGHFKRAYDLTRKYAPKAKIYTWSDMFTPHHNARPFKVKGYYYLVNGNWNGAWENLPKDVIILNWYSPKPEGMKFFADRGHKQIICGYYDGKTTDHMKKNIRHWMSVSKDIRGVRGVMFTTWRRRYQYMKEYFQLLDSYKQWSGSLPPLKKN